jgi:hypothetical protein
MSLEGFHPVGVSVFAEARGQAPEEQPAAGFNETKPSENLGFQEGVSGRGRTRFNLGFEEGGSNRGSDQDNSLGFLG